MDADWPDLEDGNSCSETEELTTAEDTALSNGDQLQSAVIGPDGFATVLPSSSSSHSNAEIAMPSSELFNIPDSSASYTAQKIMHLLDEIGTSNLVERSINSRRFLHCSHCSGRLIDL